MIVLRAIAGFCLLLAAFAIAYDATRAGPDGSWVFLTLGQHWAQMAPNGLAAARLAVQRATHPLVWDPGIRLVLSMPASLAFATLGLLFGYLGRRRRRVNVFAN